MFDSIQSVGIDVSLKKLDVYVKSSNEYISFSVSNDISGITELSDKLGNTTSPIILESSGDYHILSSCILKESNLNVYVINPIITNKLIRASIRGAKSDKKDAKLLANLGLTHIDELNVFTSNRPNIILKKEVKVLRKVKQEIKTLQKSIKALDTLSDQLEVTSDTSILKEKLKDLEKYVAKKEELILKDYNNLLSEEISKIRGVSEKAAKVIGLFLEDKTFEKANQLIAFTGYDVRRKQSGSSIDTRGSLSKRGDSNLRDILFKTAWGLKMNNEIFNEIYERARSKGKHYYTCLNILVRKLLKIIFGIIKSDNKYNGMWG